MGCSAKMAPSREFPKAMPRFNEAKTTQAAAAFLKLNRGRLNYMVLIKLLYMLDREALDRWGRTITNDEYFSMKLGPVLSGVHDLLTEQQAPSEQGDWKRFISAPREYTVDLLSDPGTGKLSEAEEDLIREVFDRFGHFDNPFDLVDFLHKELNEWTEVNQGRVALPISQILKALNKTPEEIEEIEAEREALSLAHSLMSRA